MTSDFSTSRNGTIISSQDRRLSRITLSRYAIDILIYLISFLAVYFIIRRQFLFDPEYYYYMTVYIAAVVVSSFLTQKFNGKQFKRYLDAARSYLISFILMLGMSTFILHYLDLPDISRRIVVLSLALALITELVWLRFRIRSEVKESRPINIILSSKAFFAEITIFIGVTIYLGIETNKNFTFFYNWQYLFLELLICWFVSIALTHHFAPFEFSSTFWKSVWSRIKSYIIFIALSAFLVMALRAEGFEKLFFILGSLLYSLFSFLIFIFLYIDRKPLKNDIVKTNIFTATNQFEDNILYQDIVNDNGPRKYGMKTQTPDPTLADRLFAVYLKNFRSVYKFLDENLNLSSFDILKCAVLRTPDTYNLDVLPDGGMQLYMNLHVVNDFRRMNEYFICVNKKLIDGGIFAGRVEPISLRKKKFSEKYPYYIALVFYLIDFLWNRIFPKVPFVKKFYFSVTKGRGRVISTAETLGRLFYCGFDIINIHAVGNYVYFIAKKIQPPKTDPNPSYGLLIKLRRIGMNGQYINVFKFRTMFPYSEYLQGFVGAKANLQAGGKFKDDFRITGWGRLMRKFWIDELPMIINFLRGQLKIVGVRPLSYHYYHLYYDTLRKRRIKFKPGLVPPFYADMPKTLDEIMASEERYLDEYEKSPVVTDIKYFLKAFYNIFFKQARSK